MVTMQMEGRDALLFFGVYFGGFTSELCLLLKVPNNSGSRDRGQGQGVLKGFLPIIVVFARCIANFGRE